MKRIAIIAILLQLFIFADHVSARDIWYTPNAPIQTHQLIYLSVRDEYQLRYKIGGFPQGTTQARANFWAASGAYYEVVFDQPTGIAYLTCNGIYIFELLDASGNVLAETTQIVTHKIVNPTCKSYENTGFKNTMNGKVEQRPEGGASIEWDIQPNTHKYEIYKDGELWHQFLESSNQGKQTMAIFPNGAYTIWAVDANGNYVGTFDFLIGADDGSDGGGDGDNGNGSDGGCNACQWLSDLLDCPSWSDYMGDITNAIRDALPPPPDWDNVASTFVDHFADYFGNVPAVPTKQQIQNEITPPTPTLDTSVPDANITPQVPSAYDNAPLDTDITSGEVIEIIDESEPFMIYEPDEFINSDDVGVMVYPNDPRNSSDGIKEPDQINTGYPLPTPQPRPNETIPTPQPQPTAPVVDIPIPTNAPYTTPIPTDLGGNMPTPQPIGGENH